MIGKKAKQKKTLERRDEVTTFCLTVNEKRQTTKKKITGQRHHTSNVRKQCLRTAIYSNPMTQYEESHADRELQGKDNFAEVVIDVQSLDP